MPLPLLAILVRKFSLGGHDDNGDSVAAVGDDVVQVAPCSQPSFPISSNLQLFALVLEEKRKIAKQTEEKQKQTKEKVGQKLKGSFLPGVVFAKGWQFLLVSRAEGFGVVIRGVVGGDFLLKNEGKGEGGGKGGGWDGDRQRNRQVNAQALSKLPFSKLPFSFPPKKVNRRKQK